ncbi:MAG: SMP-30/gluconolactonase/LRE family protein [Polyangiaceae bacterium]|nr:SMP-30/gluconolactonase/LRE family protein [Polyangiaceae bacterium]
MSDADLQCISPIGDRCGEAATWSSSEQALYWCDVNRFLIHRMGADGGVKSWFFKEPVTALSLTDTEGELLVALGSRLILWRADTNERRDQGFHLKSWPKVRLNDGRAAPNGDFWVGSMANNVGPRGEMVEAERGLGELFRVRRGAPTTTHKSKLGISNTVCWSPDERTFYFGDTQENMIWAYDYDSDTGEIQNERPFFSGYERGAPDGSTVDSAGCLWNCRFGGSCVVRVTPEGRIDRVLELPVRNVTTCAFGGTDFRTLFITTASILTDESDQLAGSLFTLDTTTPGLDGFKAHV